MTFRRAALLVPIAAFTAWHAPVAPQGDVTAVPQTSGTTARLIAVSAPMQSIAWASGARGTFVRTLDGGETWKAAQVPGAEALEFRDVHAVDANNAYLLAAGNGDKSRIYHTKDGGATWLAQYTNTDSAAFYDCMDFWDATHGIVIGDAVHGELAILTTSDGEHWARVPGKTLPPPVAKEGSFASSGTCVVTQANGRAWFATTKGRVLRTSDYGKTWQVALTPITVAGDTMGVTSVSFRDNKQGMAFGGYGAMEGATMVATTSDGGATWEPAARPDFPGGMYGGAFVRGALKATVVALGPGGSAYSRDNGATWLPLDKFNYWGLGFAPSNRGYAVGTNGRITRLNF